jgi:hypothetical protein
MPAETDLVNVALNLIAHEEITNIMDTTNAVAKTARRLYPVARDAATRAAHWNCATWRQTLAEVEPSADYTQHDFSFVYQLPQNPLCLKARRFEDVGCNYDPRGRFHPGNRPFRVEGRFILTNVETPTLVYTRQIIDVNLMDALLYQATAVLLGCHFALAIRQDYKRHAELFKAWDLLREEAAGLDEAEGGRDTFISTGLLYDR